MISEPELFESGTAIISINVNKFNKSKFNNVSD